MTDNKKVLFEDIEIGTYFKVYGMLYVKVSYNHEDDNCYNFDVDYIDYIEDGTEIEVVEKVEIVVKTPE